VGLRHGFRSGLEELNSKHLKAHGIAFVYEEVKIDYLIPASKHTYTADFALLSNGIICETKGMFEAVDRAKHLYIKLLHPALDIRFVFQNPNAKLTKGGSVTYADWAERHGYKWAKKLIPIEWAKEPPRAYGPPFGPRTIAVPAENQDFFADPARLSQRAPVREAGRRVALAGKKARAP
jgi:hypothetical protein